MKPFLVMMEHGGNVSNIDSPVPTITTARGGAMGVAEPFLVLTEHGTVGRWGRPIKSVEDPLPTITTTGGVGLTSMFIIPKESGKTHAIDEPLGAITTRGAGSLIQAKVEPFIIPNFGRKKNQKPRIHTVDDPLPTVTSRGAGNLVQAFILSQASGGKARQVEEPMPTIVTAGAHSITQAFLTTYYKHGGTSSVSDPVPTVRTHDGIGLVQPVINGYTFDIRFRMLTPKELAGAMGFPKTYVFKGTRTEIVKQIGNAVAVNMAEALCTSLLKSTAE